MRARLSETLPMRYLALALCISVTVLALLMAQVRTQWWFVAIVSGALSIAAANVLWSYGVKKLGPGRTGNFGNLVPVLAFVFSYLTLHEQLVPVQFIGVAVTLAGVWIARQ